MSKYALLDFIEDGVRNGRDQRRRDLDAVNLLQVPLNLALRHPARVERDDVLVEAVEARLPLPDELRLELAGAVAGTSICTCSRLPRSVFGVVPLRELPELSPERSWRS
jgi:hypothetical protein